MELVGRKEVAVMRPVENDNEEINQQGVEATNRRGGYLKGTQGVDWKGRQ